MIRIPAGEIMGISEIPLDQIDLEALGSFLESDDAPEGTMSLSELDGFLTAIAVGPEAIAPDEWLPIVWNGAQPQFATEVQAKVILGSIISRYDEIVTNRTGGLFKPILEYDVDDSLLPFGWARGFFEGVGLRAEAWKPLLRSDRYGAALLPLLVLIPDDPDDLFLPISEEEEARFVADAPELIPESMLAIDAYWKKRGRRRDPAPAMRSEPFGFSVKVKRNDRCPCGSGKKFKKCCGGAM